MGLEEWEYKQEQGSEVREEGGQIKYKKQETV